MSKLFSQSTERINCRYYYLLLTLYGLSILFACLLFFTFMHIFATMETVKLVLKRICVCEKRQSLEKYFCPKFYAAYTDNAFKLNIWIGSQRIGIISVYIIAIKCFHISVCQNFECLIGCYFEFFFKRETLTWWSQKEESF